MKALIIYDSLYGNTERIAKAVKDAFDSGHETTLLPVKDVDAGHLAGLDLLIAGSPTQGFRPTKLLQKFFSEIPRGGLKNVNIAAFDTRIAWQEIHLRVLKIMMRQFGYAANPIAKALVKKGGKLIIPPEGFFVKETEGPLKEGEEERAKEWGRKVIEKMIL